MATLFILSETEPLRPSTGQGWIKASTGQAYQYLNGDWIPLVGDESQEIKSPLTVFMRGFERTDDINTLTIKDNLTSKVDTCSMVFDSDGDYEPEEGEEVIVLHNSNRIFGGNIIDVSKSQKAPGIADYRYDIKCVDFSHKLKKGRVVTSFENNTVKEIIESIIDEEDNNATEISYNNVQTGPTLDYISFNYKSPFDCIKELAKISGFDWYVDYDKDLHFFDKTTNEAPYQLDDTNSSGHFENLNIKVDKSQLKNVIVIQGGDYFSGAYTQTITVQDNDQDSWAIHYEPYAGDTGVSVTLNGVSKTIGLQNVDENKDFYYEQDEKVLREGDQATSVNDVIKLTYEYKVPVLTRDKDFESVQKMQLIEGGSGEYVYHETDRDIGSIEDAHSKAKVLLEDYSNPMVQGSFSTNDDGYRSGQILTIETHGYITQYLIQSVSKKWVSGNTIGYKVKFATKLLGLTDFLTDLFDKGRETIYRENETLHKLEIYENEELEMAVQSTIDKNKGLPYEWGPGGDRQAVWQADDGNVEDATFIWN